MPNNNLDNVITVGELIRLLEQETLTKDDPVEIWDASTASTMWLNKSCVLAADPATNIVTIVIETDNLERME